MSTGDLLSACQRIIDGRFRHAASARAACDAGEWAAFTRRAAPKQPALIGRGDWSACVELASKMCSEPQPTVVTVVPVWACSADDVPSREWIKVHAVVLGSSNEPYIAETGPHFFQDEPVVSELATFDARVYRVGWVVPTESYAPSIELALRRGRFGVLAGNVVVLDRAQSPSYRERGSGALPAPDLEVPEFGTRYEMRAAGVPHDLAAAIAKLSSTVDESLG